MTAVSNISTRPAAHGQGGALSRKSGFTLIELLVVIAIIALLVSLLVPSLKQAREIAKTAVCAVNLRGIHSAWSIYHTDHDGRLPAYKRTVWGEPASGSGNYTWVFYMREELSPAVQPLPFSPGKYYVDQDSILSCPATDPVPEPYNTLEFVDYGMNKYGIGGGSAGWSARGLGNGYRKIEEIPFPGEQIGFGDSAYSYNPAVGYHAMHPWNGSIGFPHLDRTNMAYVDGHVQTWDLSIAVIPAGAGGYLELFDEAPWGNP